MSGRHTPDDTLKAAETLLASLLTDRNSMLRAVAVEHPAATDRQILAALCDPHPAVREAAIRAAKRRDSKAMALAVVLVKGCDGSWEVDELEQTLRDLDADPYPDAGSEAGADSGAGGAL